MSFKTLIFVLISLLLVASCSQADSKGPFSTGLGSEILIVGGKAEWDGPVGDTIRNTLTHNMEGLPENEPEFTLVFVQENSFSKTLKMHRNVLIADINPENKKSRVETLLNVWAYPQRVIKIKASSDTGFIRLFAEHSDAIKELFNQNERAWYCANNAVRRNTTVEKMLADDFGIRMVISKDFYQAIKTTDFVLLRADSIDNSLGLMIYTYPFKDTSQVNPDTVIAARERYIKVFSVDSVAHSYNEIERDMYKTMCRKILFKGMYAVQTSGLLKQKGDAPGEPFINYTIVDAPRQRIVVFDGIVYYPDKSKWNYIHQLEAIIWGAEFGNPAIGEKK